MRILYISAEFNDKNGANKSASDVLYSFLSNGYEVEVVSCSSIKNLNKGLFQGEVVKKLKWNRVKRILQFKRVNSPIQLTKLFIKKVLNIFAKRIEKLTFNPDVIVVNSIGSDDLLRKIKSITTCPKVNIFRGSPESFGIQGSTYTVDEVSDRLGKYDFLVFVSDIVRLKWLKYDTIKNIPSLYLPNCCEEEIVERIKKIRAEDVRGKLYADSSRQKFILVYVASVQFRKGHDILLEHAEYLFSELTNLELYFVGDNTGAYAKRMEEEFNSLAASRKIHFVGGKSNALEYIYGADILIFPSRAEALPRVILEAMALGTTIVSSNVDGIPELIQDGHNGYLFDIKKTEKMVDHLIELARNPQLKTNFEIRSRERYETVFSRKQHIKNYKELINKISDKYL